MNKVSVNITPKVSTFEPVQKREYTFVPFVIYAIRIAIMYLVFLINFYAKEKTERCVTL